uniref:Protocadherin 2 alpha a 15 n=1 Tax=Salarias fasciatus TaxID=181472 RepID=A0A672FM24_SALFA
MNQNILNVFDINSITGEVTVKGVIDYETNDEYEIEIQASDKGLAPLTTEKSVIIKIVDVNDNAPEIEVTSFSRSIPEDSRPGTTVALISVKDVDSGLNGKVICYVSDDVTFTLTATLKDKMFSLTTKSPLDRERRSQYDLTIIAKDSGTPQLSSEKTINVVVSDVNDNKPEFSLSPYTFYVNEGNNPGASVFSVTASDCDENDNARILYHVKRESEDNNFILSFLNINSETGDIVSLKSLDFENLKTFQFQVIVLCTQSSSCVINLKTVLENPLEVHYVEVEVLDINDHSPTFPEEDNTLEISESVLPGARFQLKPAQDLDSGQFSVQQYKLTLDRETAGSHSLTLTALDGGKPQKAGNTRIQVKVLDINDNAPTFSKDVYSVTLTENAPIGTTVIQVNATDLDEGPNGQVVYSFGKSINKDILNIFQISPSTGLIMVKNLLDYEKTDEYEIEIQASDRGLAPLTTEKSVIIKIVDINDNAPEIKVTSFSSSIPEDSKPGTTVALINVNDLDSGLNGEVICNFNTDVPFTLLPSLKDKMFSLVTKSPLDRERESQYDLTIIAKDSGTPQLSTEKTINVVVSDVNDNKPEFSLSPYTFYVNEGNNPGAPVFSVTASDRDENDNARISYHVNRDSGDDNKLISFLNMNSETGTIVALKSFDFETVKTFQFQVVATDSGTPSLSNNVTVNVFILDQNDNAPVILYPLSSNGSAEGEVTDHSLFGLDRYTGQIRTLRSFTETDEAEHKLVILVKDNGNVSLSATATVIVKLVEPKEAFAASDVKSGVREDEDNNVTFYLMITLGSVSVLFLISIIVLIAMQCSKSTDYTSKYLQETNYDGTLIKMEPLRQLLFQLFLFCNLSRTQT